MDKIKEFFKSKIVKIAAWIMLVGSAVILLVSGYTTAHISSVATAVQAAIVAIGAVISLICSLINPDE